MPIITTCGDYAPFRPAFTARIEAFLEQHPRFSVEPTIIRGAGRAKHADCFSLTVHGDPRESGYRSSRYLTLLEANADGFAKLELIAKIYEEAYDQGLTDQYLSETDDRTVCALRWARDVEAQKAKDPEYDAVTGHGCHYTRLATEGRNNG